MEITSTVVVNLFKTGDKAYPENDRGISLRSRVGKTSCKSLIDIMGTRIRERRNSRPRASIGLCRTAGSEINVYTLGNIGQSRKYAGLVTHCLFLDLQKAYGTIF